jgi:hypothetical protein
MKEKYSTPEAEIIEFEKAADLNTTGEPGAETGTGILSEH